MNADRSQPVVNDSQDNVSKSPVEFDDPKSSELSLEFVGRWGALISRTNWEKGKIICQWRETLINSQASPSTYSDEAWSRRVGGVTPQHVGRLRRVYDRFSAAFETYPGLYWSHFLAAVDWDDAEMWLEGAAQSSWSVSAMRRTRWESMGSDPAAEPLEADIIASATDEDFTPLSEVDDRSSVQDGARGVAEGPRFEGPDFGDEADSSASTSTADDDELPWESNTESQESPFEKLPSLPVDLMEAVEQFKLAIIRHRADAWADVKQADVIQALEALKAFAAL